MYLKCELIANYAGFSLLHAKGELKLKQTIPAEFLQNKHDSGRWVDYKFFNTQVIVNDKIRVCYDTHDWNWIDENILKSVDFYFKRSYDKAFLAKLDERHKVFPLGLNYQVTTDKADFFRLKRAAFYGGKDKIKLILKALRLDNFLPNAETERLDRMESAPDFALEPRVLFVARAWNTETILDRSQREIVKEINETRAESMRVLRRKFGEKISGGLVRDRFAEKHFNDVLLTDEILSAKRDYLHRLKSFPICVTTTGLNNSNGWKLAEYVAFSKAVVTEPLKFQITGDFANEKNYLEFTDSESLLNQVSRLFDDKNLRDEMMKNNHEYYNNFLRPDALVLNTLKIVADHCGFSF